VNTLKLQLQKLLESISGHGVHVAWRFCCCASLCRVWTARNSKTEPYESCKLMQ